MYEETGALGRLGVQDINIALIYVALARWDDARRLLDRAEVFMTRRGGTRASVIPAACRLPVNAALGDFAAWRRDFDVAAGVLGRWHLIDMAELLTLAGELAAVAGRFDEAREAWGLAVVQWNALKRLDRAGAVEADLETLPR
jgi:hypothetical protein